MGLEEEEEEVMLAKKKNKKEKGLSSAEELVTAVDSNGVEAIEDGKKKKKKKKKKREKREKKLKGKDESVVEIGFFKEEKRNKVEREEGRYDGGEMNNEKELDCEVELGVKKDKKKKRKKEKNIESEEGEFERNEQEDNTVVDGEKKGSKKKKKKDKMGGDVDAILINNGSHEGGDASNENLHLSKDEKESHHATLSEVKKDKKKKEEKRHKSKEDILESNEQEDMGVDVEVGKGFTINREKNVSKKRKDQMGGDAESHSTNSADEHSTKDKKRKNSANDNARNEEFHDEGGSSIDVGCSKKRKKEKRNKDHIQDCSREILEMPAEIEKVALDDSKDNHIESSSGSVGKKKRDREKDSLHMEMEKLDKKKRKKAKSIKDVEDNSVNEGEARTKNKDGSADCSGNLKLKKPSKRVKFSGKIEVFPISDVRDAGKENQEGSLVRGKRFSKEEDTILKNAVLNYIKEHDLGEDGLKKVLRCQSNPEARNCWKEISVAMPWRPLNSIYNRAHVLFERGEKREWTPEEKEELKKFHEKHGADWRTFGDENNKSRIHVKDTWRRICLPNKKGGSWSQDEYQKLFDLVNMDLRMKAFEEKKSKHGMLRDNIAWEAISSKLSTRTNADCCLKWYKQLESPLVRDGKWVSSDDFRLLNELLNRDFCSEEEVDWDNLLDHRPGDICRKRWHQMVNHLGAHGNKAFADKVEVLTKRYCPDVLEAREAYENKTPVT